MSRRALGALAVVLAVGVLALPRPAHAEDELEGVDRVLMLSLPDLTWSRFAEAREHVDLPNLEALFEDSALADLAARGVARNPSAGAAYLTVSAGTRATTDEDIDGDQLEGEEPIGGETAGEAFERRTEVDPSGDAVALGITRLQDVNEAETYEAEVGLFADVLAEADVGQVVIANADGTEGDPPIGRQRQAALALVDGEGRIPGAHLDNLLVDDPTAPYGLALDPDKVLDAFSPAWADEARVALVEASDLARAGRYAALATPEQADRLWEDALVRTDELLGRLLAEVDPERDAVLAFAPFHFREGPNLTLAALRAPGIAAGELDSALTRRTGYVTLTDVAPTVLDLLDLEQPEGMEGGPMTATGGDRSLDDRLEALVDGEERANFRDDVSRPVAIAVAVYTGVAFALLLLVRGRRAAALLPLVGAAGLGFLWGTHVAALLPFEDHGIPAYVGFLVLTCLLVAVVAWAIGRLDRPATGLLAASGLLWLTLVVDLATGANLQLDTALGYSATVAFRFSGLGNFGFAELAATALLVAGLVLHRWPGTAGRVSAIAVLVIALVVDAAPSMGADVGGIIAATPTFLAFVLLVRGRAIPWSRVVLLGVATAALLAVFAVLDLLRPESSRTHLGRLVDRVIDEGAGPLISVIERKATAVVTSVATPWAVAVVLAVAGAVLLLRQRGDALRRTAEAYPEARPVALALVIGGVLGTLVNDSGLAVGAVMFMIGAAASLTLVGPRLTDRTSA